MNRKYNKGIWILGGLVFFLILVIFSNLSEEKKEKETVKEKIQEENKFVQEFNQKNKGKNISNFYSNQKEKISEKEEFDNLPDNKPTSIPYTKPLPPTPDPQLVKEYFIDQNNNGVRDDIEIEIVQEFEEDRDVVEAFFLVPKIHEYIYYLDDINSTNYEDIQKAVDGLRYAVRCINLYYNRSPFRELDSSNWITYIESFSISYDNTTKRREKIDRVMKKFSGHTSTVTASENSCQNFFQKTKELIPESRRYVMD
jgi:hypothetical protein